jgi:hypothetical protein
MKRNTGCGCNDHHDKCPPLPSCDKADTKTVECNVEPFTTSGDVELTVVLADVIVQSMVEANIKLPTFAREIKQIRKNVSLKQCKAIPNILDPTGSTVKLFITGIVHKNIQFVEDCTGVVKDHGVDVHFSCNQLVELTNPVVFPFGTEFSVKNSVLERRELAKDGHGADRCESGSLTFEIFNEPIQCKLLFSVVNELDILTDFDNWGRFEGITEKMDVLLGIKLFQKQQDPTPIPTPTPLNGLGSSTFSTPNQLATIQDRFRQITGFGR